MGLRVGWLADRAANPGGAELTQDEFKQGAPDGIEIVECPAGEVANDCDRYVIHNCVQYTEADLANINMAGAPAVKFWHDVGPWLPDDVRQWLYTYPTSVCCSPIQADYMGLDDAKLIPPPVDLDRFTAAGAKANGSRNGAVCIGSWRNYGKAPHKAAEWAAGNGGIDFYGGGPLAPPGSMELAYEEMPAVLAQYRTFVFLPTVLEPFGRVVGEAWAAGCELVVNGLVGAGYWIEQNPDAITTAAEDFWGLVLDD